MRKVIEEYTVYTIEELAEMDDQAYERAIEQTASQRITDVEFTMSDMIRSLETFYEEFGLRVTDYSMALFTPRNYIKTDADDFRGINTNEDINYYVQQLNDIIKNERGLNADFTGVYTDGYINEFFTEFGIDKVTYNDIHKHLNTLAGWALNKFLSDMEDDILNEEYTAEYAMEFELEFTTDGDII